MTGTALLAATNLQKTYVAGNQSTRALWNLNLVVPPGEFVAVMGPSGSGKTTLLNLLAGLDAPTGGSVVLDGQDMGALKGDALAAFRRERLGFVFQDFNLLDTLTLAENASLPLLLAGHGHRDARRSAVGALTEIGIGDLAGRFPYEVSGGQQQRAAVARAIVHQPTLVLADEPTGALDTGAATSLLELFERLNAQLGATIVMVTHNPRAASYASRVVFISDGAVFTELGRDGLDRQSFFASVMATLGQLEGR